MGDELRTVFGLIDLRYREMGDGSHAEVVSVHGSEVGLVAGTEVDLIDGAEVGLVDGTGVYLIDSTGAIFGTLQTDGQIRTINTPYPYQIAESNIPGHYPVRRYGHNHDVGTSPETVSHIDALMYYPAVAEILMVRSDDADDDGDPAGTGAHTVWYQGLNNAYGLITDTITLNGTTAVPTNKPFLRVFKKRVLTAGASGHNEGTITTYGNDNASKIDAIYDGENESHSASFTVPAGQTLYILDLTISDSTLKAASVDLYACPFEGLWYLKRPYSIVSGATPIPLSLPLVFAEKTDVELRATAIAAGAVVNAGFDGWREDN